MDKIINNQTAPQDQWQAFTDSEKMVLRESYAQQYIKEALPKLIESRQSPVLKRLVNTPDNAAKAAILGSMNKK